MQKYIESTASGEIIGFIISVLIIALFSYLLWIGKSWIRWVLLVFFVIGVIPSVLTYSLEFKINPFLMLLSLAQLITQLVAIILMFNNDSKKWIQGLNENIVETDS